MARITEAVPQASTQSNLLYRMSTANRFLLWMPRILLGVAIVGAAVGIVFSHNALAWRIVDAVVMSLSLVLLLHNRRQMSPIIVRAELEGSDIRFRRSDGTIVTVPRRGRSLRKVPHKSNQAWVVLETTADKQFFSLMAQDKDAMALLEDLDRRGVVRGPGNPKDKYPGMPVGGRR